MQRSKRAKIRSANSVLAITTLSHMMQHIFVGTSVLFPLIIADLNLNYTEFGFVVASASLIGGLFQIFFSVASRRIARHVLLGLGNILLSFGTSLMGIVHNITHLFSARTIANIGTAPQHPIGTAIVSEKFNRENIGKAMGIHYGIAYVGNIIGPLFMTFLAATMGWRNTLLVFALPALIVGLTVISYLNEEKSTELREKRTVSSLRSDIISLAKTKSVFAIIATQALVSGGTDLGIITTYTPLFLADGLRLEIYQRGILYTIGLVGGVVGPLLLGKYADKAGHLMTATFSLVLAVVCVYLLALYDSANLILAFHLFLLGFASFSLPTLLQSHLIEIATGYQRDLVVGLFFTTNFLFGSLWTGVMGYIIDVYSFKPAFIAMGTLGSLALIMVVEEMRRSRGRR